jgi:hypothetical protein
MVEFQRIQWAGYFELDIPFDWIHVQDDDLVTLRHAYYDLGVLQCSIGRRDRNTSPKADAMAFAQRFASRQGWHPDRIIERKMSESSLATFECVDEDGAFWRYWIIVGEKRIATFTYTTSLDYREIERAVCDQVLATFNWM